VILVFLVSKPRSSSDDDLFKDWSEVNDMAMSVYVALSAMLQVPMR
jgi:hypothetical protein